MSASQLIDAALCGVRHLRSVQSLIGSSRIDQSKEEALWESEDARNEFRSRIRVVPKEGPITQGEQLARFPVLSHIVMHLLRHPACFASISC